MADPSTSAIDTLTSAVRSLVGAGAADLAKALGVWTAARAAISTVASGIAAAATQRTINEALAKYQGMPLSPAVLADMVVRNIIPQGKGAPPKAPGTPANWPAPLEPRFEASAEAAYSGLNPDRFSAMVLDTGESYGIVDALRLWNRGKYMYELKPNPDYPAGQPLYVTGANLARTYGITDDELYSVIAYSRMRNQFTPDMEKLAKNSLSPADAVELAVKQIVTTDVARSLFEAAGGVGEQFDALVDAAGDSMGVVRAAELHRLGLISDAKLTQILGLSRLNPRFYDLVPLLAVRQLPIYELRQAVVNGTMDEATALERMVAQGYNTADAKLFLQAVEMGQIGAAKAETEGMVLADWQAGLVTEAQATDALVALGEKPWAIPFILDTVMAKKVTLQRNAVVTRVRAAVLYGDVTPATAVNYLVQLGWAAKAASEAVDGWVIEAETPHELLSTAQIGKLLEDGNISADFAVAYWVRRGYTQADALLLMYIYPPGVKGHYKGGPAPFEPPRPAEPEPLPPGPAVLPIYETGPHGIA